MSIILLLVLPLQPTVGPRSYGVGPMQDLPGTGVPLTGINHIIIQGPTVKAVILITSSDKQQDLYYYRATTWYCSSTAASQSFWYQVRVRRSSRSYCLAKRIPRSLPGVPTWQYSFKLPNGGGSRKLTRRTERLEELAQINCAIYSLKVELVRQLPVHFLHVPHRLPAQ